MSKVANREEKEREWNDRYYGGLLNAVCIGVGAHRDEEGNLWPRLRFRTPEGDTLLVEVSCDEEGNRPGFLFGLPVVKEEDNPFLRDKD